MMLIYCFDVFLLIQRCMYFLYLKCFKVNCWCAIAQGTYFSSNWNLMIFAKQWGCEFWIIILSVEEGKQRCLSIKLMVDKFNSNPKRHICGHPNNTHGDFWPPQNAYVDVVKTWNAILRSYHISNSNNHNFKHITTTFPLFFLCITLFHLSFLLFSLLYFYIFPLRCIHLSSSFWYRHFFRPAFWVIKNLFWQTVDMVQ